ncbi:TRAP transporter small permease [Xanthobacter dioxanivorans]|uniref:TRAP transporter small permease protein n=1 Tax=Xanthobacter dioxanivorans TaxID=2528964 RepID=A0A974PTR8_9HYPH|nr:TRAP transporter small permease [Xanthobacter dioxanivorans]QRG09093.1 TRAP transporter small permease [Xanthobacter dioxanivorans]
MSAQAERVVPPSRDTLSAVATCAGHAIAAVAVRIAGVALLAIVAINCANVVGRYFFAAPIGWAEEAMLYLMVLLVFSAMATVTWQGRHISIELVADLMPAAARKAARLLVIVLTVATCLLVASSSYEVVSMLHAFDQRSDALEMPIWIPQGCILVGLVLAGALTVLRLLAYRLDEPERRLD